MSHIQMSLVTQRHAPCHVEECVMSHLGMSYVTHTNALRHTLEWVMLHKGMCHVTQRNDICDTYECVVSHLGMTHVTHRNVSCHTEECVMWRIGMRHVTHRNESCETWNWVTIHVVMNHRHKSWQVFTNIHKYSQICTSTPVDAHELHVIRQLHHCWHTCSQTFITTPEYPQIFRWILTNCMGCGDCISDAYLYKSWQLFTNMHTYIGGKRWTARDATTISSPTNMFTNLH